MKYDVSKSNRLGNRKSNQDRIGVVETSEAVLLVLADGLGGHAGGDVAAETVVDCAFRYFNNASKPIRNPGTFLSEVIQRIHREILTLAASCDPPLKAKSTCVLCIIQDGFAHWAHVGDSRLYVVRNNKVIKRHFAKRKIIPSGKKPADPLHWFRKPPAASAGCPGVSITTGRCHFIVLRWLMVTLVRPGYRQGR